MSEFVNPERQAIDLIREIGDGVSQTGQPLGERRIDDRFTCQLIDELVQSGIVVADKPVRNGRVFWDINLTLEGWQRYEREKRGELKGNYGFIAMQFGDRDLDDFVRDVVKPAVKKGIEYDLVDMRDVPRAGIIDNIMRVQVRDADFVIADLTHGNQGAYWEAGYAEGLGKPVVYICERTKFETERTHFDTNHCTTVPWSTDKPERFSQELIATLRRSLEGSS